MKDADQQVRLRRFWGAAIFSLGTLWGIANCVYFPIAALTSIVGSSWLEVFVILAGGILTFIASIAACFAYEIFFAHPLWRDAAIGFIPRAEILAHFAFASPTLLH